MQLFDCQTYAAGEISPDPTWRMPAHSHPFHEIIVVRQGRLHLNPTGQKPLVAKKGDILFYRAGFIHEEISDPRAPAGTHFFSFATGELLPWLPLRVHDTQGRLRQLAGWMIEDQKSHRAPETRRPLFEAFLSELRKLCEAPPHPWLEAIRAYMHQHLAQPLTLDDLARCGGMSRFAFVRRYKHLSGLTPMRELRLTRLNRARTLLLATDLPVKAIAFAVGIGDEFQLSKLFRAQFKMSPREVRAR